MKTKTNGHKRDSANILLEASIRQHIGEDIACPMVYNRPSRQEE